MTAVTSDGLWLQEGEGSAGICRAKMGTMREFCVLSPNTFQQERPIVGWRLVAGLVGSVCSV